MGFTRFIYGTSGVCGILLEGVETVRTLVARATRPRCGHHIDPASVRAVLGGPSGYVGSVFRDFAQCVSGYLFACVFVSHTSSIFANLGLMDRGRVRGNGVEGSGLRFRVWKPGWFRIQVKSIEFRHDGCRVQSCVVHGLGLRGPRLKIEARVSRLLFTDMVRA